ncbi:acyl-CoA dehydrogenase family protein [Micromonospora auratinigra]|uniref:acyl-CoA dehydrogenase family protein n=1 Tax=Micromonospora auratinigra TaxID=261654 RepID=UPI000B803D7E|nr:acyl-CoA dehydrogenase family protein [Micromonospora auratinigra]
MDFGWSTEQQTRYAETLAAVRAAFPTAPDGFYDRKDWTRLAELGLTGACVPRAYGGGGLGALDTARLLEAVGRGCPDTGLVFATAAHLFACAMPIADFGSAELRARWLPGLCSGELIAGNAMTEAEAGSDVSRLAVTATPVDGGWLLNGVKTFISNGPVADVYVTYATTDPAAGHFGTTAFVVDRTAPGVHPDAPFDKLGMASCPAGGVTFTDCFVPAGQVIGEPGQGGVIFQHSMGWERTCLFALFLGVQEELVDRVLAHVRQRRQFGRALAEFQSVSNRIVEMKLRLESGRLLLYRACWEMDQGDPSTLWSALSKLAVSEAALAGAIDAVQLFGGAGYLRGTGVEAALRDAIGGTIFSGTSDIQRWLVAAELGL